ncbi:MAG: Hsp70 family protein [Dysgonamonadaceae bacterium]|jgi:molecular chaperone DnaK (HSP70)|nr:Hsp70 family protein [Dysgonamonadaceae bacterium]
MDKSRLVYGIDLGTTYSCISQIDEFDKAVVIRNQEGDVITPSVVYIDGDNVVVGKEAKSLSADEPEKTVAFIKREIGVDGSFSKPTRFPGGFDPVEISSMILKKLVQDANAASDSPEPIKDVVIACPAYFGTKERLQTKQAGQMAGLNVLAIINEPTAAAIAYGMRVDDGSRKIIMVYDLGGGTFDVTVIRVESGTVKVIATGGDHKLGGYDWDMKMAEYILNAYNEEHGTDYDLNSDSRLTNQLLLEAEAKKKTLTAKDSVKASVTWNGVSSKVEITRNIFDDETETLLSQTIDFTRKLLDIAQEKGFGKIDEVLLVGGSSRMPQVKKRVDAELGVNARLDDPDECVAKGAAKYALNEAWVKAVGEWENDETGEAEKPAFLSKGNRVKTVNVTSKTYGTDIVDNYVKNMIFANTSLPAKAVETFTLNEDGQTCVSMCVYESDVTDTEKDRIIEERHAIKLEDRKMQLRKAGGYPKGTPVNVVFEIDDEGILSVHSEMAGEAPLDFTLRITGVRGEADLAEAAQRIGKMIIE